MLEHAGEAIQVIAGGWRFLLSARYRRRKLDEWRKVRNTAGGKATIALEIAAAIALGVILPVWLTALLFTAGCTSAPERTSEPPDAFLAAIRQHCGQAFAGRIAANDPEPANDPFVGQPLVMHVRECSDGEIRIPFHVGDDRSRTWVLTRTSTGIRLKHDHRHEDGSPDPVTMYGGDSAGPGTAARQAFPVDADSRALFEREGLTASVTNTWAMEIEPGRRFRYELTRPGRTFQVDFDLTSPIATPSPPWGAR